MFSGVEAAYTAAVSETETENEEPEVTSVLA